MGKDELIEATRLLVKNRLFDLAKAVIEEVEMKNG